MLERIYKDGGGDYENGDNTYTVHVDEIREANYLVGHQFVVSDVTKLHNKMDELEKMTELVLISYLVISFGYVLYVVFSNREKDFYFSIIVLMSTLVVTFNYLGIF